MLNNIKNNMLEPIQETMQKKSFQILLEEWKEERQKCPTPKKIEINACWVKKTVPKKKWNAYFSEHFAYCFLQETPQGVEIGFLIIQERIGFYPDNCIPLSNKEILQVQAYRTARHIYPFPIVEDKKDEEEIDVSKIPF